MNKTINILLCVLDFTFTIEANAQKKKKGKKEEAMSEKVELKTEIDSVSYSIGLNMVGNIKRDFADCNFEAFVEGIKAGVADADFAITPEETQAIIQAYFQKKQEAAQAEELKKAESIKADGLKFLEENKKKEGVVTTASGLQYVVMKEGTGKQPTATSSVTVHYHGTTPDGTVFDSSVDRGQPATFGLNQVIKGWTEGVALMKEGAKYKFFIPQELAYGANPRPGGPIKPYMPLVFEVELISVNE